MQTSLCISSDMNERKVWMLRSSEISIPTIKGRLKGGSNGKDCLKTESRKNKNEGVEKWKKWKITVKGRM